LQQSVWWDEPLELSDGHHHDRHVL
jgi:hypothetical protein